MDNLKVVVTGSFGFKDIGDEAMLTEDLHYLVEECKIPRENISLIGHMPDYVAYYHNHPQQHCYSSLNAQKNAQSLLKKKKSVKRQLLEGFISLKKRQNPFFWDARLDAAIASADVALVTGGGTINTRAPDGASLIRMNAMINYFAHHGKPIFVSGQSFGPLGEYESHDSLAREIVESVEVLTVRDQHYSRRYLDLLDVKPRRFLETFDDAYSLPYKNEKLPKEVTDFCEGRKIAAICVTDYTGETVEKRNFIATVCEELLESEGYDGLLFVSHSPKDLQNLWKIRDSVANKYKDKILLPDDRLWQGAQLKRMISLCSVALGGRYHFIVFAGSSDTPFVGMCGNHYSYIKQDGFARPLGLQDQILTEKETWNKEILLQKIRSAESLSLNNESRFQRPSDSMNLLGEWLKEKAGN